MDMIDHERNLYEVTVGSFYGDLKFETWVDCIKQYTDYKTQVGFRSWMLAKGYKY